MPDIHERFSALDLIDIPDLREDIAGRPRGRVVPNPRRSITGPRRVLTAAAALLLAAATLGVLIVAFRHRPRSPVVSPPTTSTVPSAANGVISFTSAAGRLYSISPDGSNLTPLTSAAPASPGAPFPIRDPAWSPDGTRIAFTGFTGNGEESQLYTADANGAHLRAVPHSAGFVQPSWSPDGTQLAVSAGRFIFAVSSSGGHLTKLVAGFDPPWSPDGGSIAFAQRNGIERLDVASGTITPIVRGFGPVDRLPAWSPDGSQIGFEACDLSNHCTAGLVNADGSSVHQLTVCPVLATCPEGPPQYEVTWSPDGKYLAYEQSGAIYVARPDGTGVRKVTDVNGGGLTWQPLPPTVQRTSGTVSSNGDIWSTYTDPSGWSADYPSDWVVASKPLTDGPVITVTFSSTPVHGTSRTSGALLTVSHDAMPGDAASGDDSTYPLSASDFRPEHGPGPGGFSYLGFRGNGIAYYARLYVGPDASASDVAAMNTLIASIHFPSLQQEGRQENGWVSLGPAGRYPEGEGTPGGGQGNIGLIYVLRGPARTYALGGIPVCGEGENETWDPVRLQVQIQCPSGPDIRFERDGTSVPGNPPSYTHRLSAYPVIKAWDGTLLLLPHPMTPLEASRAWAG